MSTSNSPHVSKDGKSSPSENHANILDSQMMDVSNVSTVLRVIEKTAGMKNMT